MKSKKLYKSKKERIIFGVCGGIAEYFEIDPTIIRILFLLLAFAGGSGPILYVILAIIMPEEGSKDGMKDSIKDIQKRTQELAKEAKSNGIMNNTRFAVGFLIVLFALNWIIKEIFRIDFIGSVINWGIVFAFLFLIVGLRLISKTK